MSTALRRQATGKMVDTACAVIAPGQAKSPPTPTDMDILHFTCGHTHEALLKETAMQQGVSLSGELHDCPGCSMEPAHPQVDIHPSR